MIGGKGKMRRVRSVYEEDNRNWLKRRDVDGF